MTKYIRTRLDLFKASFLGENVADENSLAFFLAQDPGVQSEVDDPNLAEANLCLKRPDEEHAAQKALFTMGWSKAEMVQMKLDMLEEETKVNRAKVDNLAQRKKERSDLIKSFQNMEDMVMLGQLPRKTAVGRLYAYVRRCDVLLKDSKKLNKSGHSFSGIAALKNNALSILANMGERVADSAYIMGRDYSTKKMVIIDHEYTEETRREEHDGEAWKNEVMMHLYDLHA
jgi:hypothetical protein